MQDTPLFQFRLYRFTGPREARTTELVREVALADGMRTVINNDKTTIQACCERVREWAASKGLNVTAQEPFPSVKYQGKVWLEFRFGGMIL